MLAKRQRLDAELGCRITVAVGNPNLQAKLEEEFTLACLSAAMAKLNVLATGLGIEPVKDPLQEKCNFYAYQLDAIADALIAGVLATIDAAKMQGAQEDGAKK